MLDNLMYLLTDTVLPWYLIILVVQIILLWFAKRKNSRVLWIVLYAVIIGSIVFSFVAVSKFAYGLSNLANEFFSIAALVIYPVMLSIALAVKKR